MAKLESITVATQTKYVFVIFPFATYRRIGEVGILTVLGFPVYKRVGSACSIFGVIFNAP